MNAKTKTPAQIEKMRTAGKLAASVLDYIADYVRPGISTGELDKLCAERIAALGASAPTINYAPQGHPPYPCATCISVNHQVCHGVPSFRKMLRRGDIVNIDITVQKDGWHGDTSRMYYAEARDIVGDIESEESFICMRLSQTALECLWLGMAQVAPGRRLGDIGAAIQECAEGRGYGVVRDFCGHGLGASFHEPPQILHYGKRGEGAVLVQDMVFTIEPMINAGSPDVKTLADGWTAVTRDRSLSANGNTPARKQTGLRSANHRRCEEHRRFLSNSPVLIPGRT